MGWSILRTPLFESAAADQYQTVAWNQANANYCQVARSVIYHKTRKRHCVCLCVGINGEVYAKDKSRTLDWFSSHLANSIKKVEQAQDTLRAYQVKHGVVEDKRSVDAPSSALPGTDLVTCETGNSTQ